MRLERRVDSFLQKHYNEFTCLPSREYVTKRGKQRFRLPKRFTKELARLLGLLHGDGNMSGNRILFTDKCKPFHAKIRALFRKEFGLTLNLFEDRLRNSCYSHTKNKVIYEFFVEVLEAPRGAVRANLRIPKFIWDWSDELKSAYVGGLFDAEGSVSKRQAEIGFYSTSEELFDFVKAFLQRSGISFSVYRRRRHKNEEFEIHVYGKDDLKRFAREVDFFHPEKKKRLALFLRH